MKKDIHPTNYRFVIFCDANDGTKMLTRSTVELRKDNPTIKWKDGNTYPIVNVPTTSSSHPFWLKDKKVELKATGRVARFYEKYGKKGETKQG